MDGFDWQPILAALGAVLAVVIPAAAAWAAAKIRAMTAAAETAVVAAKRAEDAAAASAASVTAKLDGVVLQLDGKLTAHIEEVRRAAHALGVLDQKERQASVQQEVDKLTPVAGVVTETVHVEADTANINVPKVAKEPKE